MGKDISKIGKEIVDTAGKEMGGKIDDMKKAVVDKVAKEIINATGKDIMK